MTPSRIELESFRDATLPDLAGPGMRLLFVGINPGLRSAAVQAHFAPRGNRFFPALHLAGVTDGLIDASSGLSARDASHLIERGIGITNLVDRTTARADEVTHQELVEGAAQLADRVRRYRPAVVAILGVTAYRVAFAVPQATLGPQAHGVAGVALWVLPNPSGRNAHASLADLGAAYGDVAVAAGIRLAGTAEGA